MMQRVLKNNWMQQWVFGLLVALFIGLLVSRAAVSFASVLIAVPFLFYYKAVNKKLLVAVGLIFLPVMISFFWSDDKTLCWNSFAVKLPLLTMMLGLGCVTLTEKKWIQIACIYIIIISIGCCWSLYEYASNYAEVHAGYLRSKTLPTPADNDHIRFSWMVVVAVLFCARCAAEKKLRWMMICLGLFLILYLHVLAAKTGLISLYAAGFIYLIYLIFFQKKWKMGLGLLIIFSLVAALCYQTMPTLRNRMQYVLYDFSNYSKGNTLPGYNDASRLLSMKAGYAITQEHPLTGVGFGDMLPAIDQWHQENHPVSLPYERFLPANEWLVYGTGSGLPGLLCFTAGFFLLLYGTTSKSILSIILSAVSVIPFLIDDTLEGQTGVIVLGFIAFFGQQKISRKGSVV